MKITKRQLQRIIREELDIEDQRAMDMGIIPYPDGTYAGDFEGSHMDLEDYQRLESLLQKDLKVFLRGGYTKEDIIEALKSIVEDA